MPSKEYLETLLEKAKQYLPDWLMRDLHRAAMPAAGGKARWREPEEPSFLEKMALAEMRPDKLKDAPDDEVRQAWLRLHQWYASAKKRGEAVENIVNAAIWVMEEFDRRGFNYDENSELVQEARKLRDVKKAQSLEAKLANLPQEVVVVPNFVCVVGSSATDKEKPEDIDVLFRANRDESGDNFLVQAQNVWLPVRKVLDPEKKGGLHFIDSPQGSHADYIPCYSLVLRREGLKRQVVKGAGDPLEDWEYLLHHMHEPDDEAHHCVLVDHLGNKYRIEHLDHGGEIYHVLAGLERGQEVLWSEEEARKAGLRVPCAGRQFKDVEKAGLPKPIRSPGGKDAWLDVLLEKIPPHKIYVEPYVGGGSLFWAKEPSEQEVLSDINEELMAVYRFLQSGTDEDFAWMRKQKWEWSPSHYEELKAASPKILRERAYRYKFLSLFGVRGQEGEIDRSDRAKSYTAEGFLRNLERYRDRLQSVKLLARDALRVIRDYDGENTFFYLDPPWKPVGRGEQWRGFDEEEFTQAVKGLRGKALISYQGSLDLGRRFSSRGYTRSQGGIGKESRQMLYWNYGVSKADALRLDLGCGQAKPDGFVGIDKQAGGQVDVVADLEEGIPFPDTSAEEIRANHVLEHLSDKEKIMAEVWRVLKPGGRFVFEVPSTKGEGAFAHPDHKSWWNKSSFVFWTGELAEGRPRFEIEEMEELDKGDLVYVRGVLRKPEAVEKAGLAPMGKFIPPKPSMAGYTEAYTVKELLDWIGDGWPVAVEPKHNGFRCIAEKKGGEVRLWFEGQAGKDQLGKLPEVEKALRSFDRDLIFDCDLGLLRQGKRAARPDLMVFNQERPRFAADEVPVLTVFDVAYWGEDLSERPFSERRKILEGLRLKASLLASPLRWCRSAAEVKVAARWAFGQDRSEGLVAKKADSKYSLDGAEEGWFKLKRVIELKVKVLAKQTTKGGAYNYWGGLLPSEGQEWKNARELDGKRYIDLGKTFSSKVEAKVGDVITCQVLELIPDGGKKELAWLGARVVDVDPARKEPYTTAQAIDVAERGEVLQKSVGMVVPPSGGEGALIAFVGARPSEIDAARGEVFAGPAGEVFRRLYLEPIGVSKEQIWVGCAVPVVKGSGPEAAEEWHEWLAGELDRAGPKVVVALGQAAKSALGDRADFVLPHPAAVRRFGDSGEVARKIKQIKRALEQVKKADLEEGDTRAEVAEKFWAENWHKMFPPDGKGRFVYHHHYRGLSEEETKLDENELLKTDHSLHGDLRFEADGELWGFSVFLGTTEENRRAGGDRLVSLPKDDNLQGQFKLSQPKAWLDVGVKEPYVSEPGGVGSTSEKYAKFFALDHGTYEIGVWREHMLELFLDGDKLKGRFLIEYAPVAGGRRVWLIDKPEDQTPYAEKHNLADVISELKQKGQKWLVWAKPGERPQKIDVIRAKVAKEYHAAILKADEEKRIVLGVVLEPDTVDSQGDIISADEIEKAAHRFLVKSRVVGDRHSKKATAEVVESYIAPDDFEMGGQKVKKGSWVIGVHISDDRLWEAVRRGEYQGFSVGGFGVRQEVA